MKVTIITGSRADWNGLGMVGKWLRDEYKVTVDVLAIGQHADCAESVFTIADDGFDPKIRRTNFATDMAIGCGTAAITIAGAIARDIPDMVLVLGDRFEILGAATACALYRVPLAHIGGGDITEGSVDNKLRFAITALADLHFVTNRESFWKVQTCICPGDPPMADTEFLKVLFDTGAPALDRIRTTPIVSRETLHNTLGLPISERNIVVAYHAATATQDTHGECRAMLNALGELDDCSFLLLGTNTDDGSAGIKGRMQNFAVSEPNATVCENLPPALFYSALAHFDLMVGNSSAGLVETASFGIPAVNIGDRQKGRPAPANVIDVISDHHYISAAISRGLRQARQPVENPYGDGHSAPRIAKIMVEHGRQL